MKSVVITGAGSGIGKATALEFAKHDYFVFLLGRDIAKLNETQKLIPNSFSIACDLKDLNSVQKAVSDINALGHSIEVLINNAGIFHYHSTEEGSDEIWLEEFQTNLMGPVRLTRSLFPTFKKQGAASIVNVSSTLGLRPSAGTSAYSSIKAALNCWTMSLAEEGAPFGIRVNCICPGIVDTPIHAFNKLPPKERDEALASMQSKQPLGRTGTAAEIARSIFFLASEQSAWTTGATLTVDGGINLL